MANQHHALRHLIHVDAKAAGVQILRAIEKARGNKGAAAELLGCSHGTMLLWIKQIGIGEEIEELIEDLKARGLYVQLRGSPSGKRVFEVVYKKTGQPIGRGGFSTMEAAEAKAAENPKQWRAQRKPSVEARAVRAKDRKVA